MSPNGLLQVINKDAEPDDVDAKQKEEKEKEEVEWTAHQLMEINDLPSKYIMLSEYNLQITYNQ